MIRGRHTLLVVEDDGVFRDAVCDLLRQEGVEVTCAEDGQDGLDLLRGGYRPCLILLDVAMPFVDGMSFRRQQLEDPEIASIPVTVVSGHPRKEKEAMRLGVSGYLRKPISPRQLLEVVERHCSHSASVPPDVLQAGHRTSASARGSRNFSK